MQLPWVRAALVVALVAVSLGLGLWRRRRDGQLRTTSSLARVTGAELDHPLGARATLLQISAEFCSPCRAAHRVLQQAAANLPGVHHVEVDAAERLDLVKRFDVMRTPTVLVLDPDGAVVHRASGVPRLDQIIAAVPNHAVPNRAAGSPRA